MKIGILGALGGIGASMLKALAVSTGSFTSVNTGPRGGKRSKVRSYLYVSASQPEDKRHWHDISQPRQLGRFSSAEAKRERREYMLNRNSIRAFRNNNAHRKSHCFEALNPLYVAK